MFDYQEYLVRVYADRTEWLNPITRGRHRLDGPAVAYNNGDYFWFYNDERHRDGDEPASCLKGIIRYYKNGLIHRDGDKPAIIYADGTQDYFIKGKLHRIGSPAIVYPSGDCDYFVEGERHREDGPAIVRMDGKNEWFLNGKRFSKEEFDREIKRRYYEDKPVEINGKKFQMKLIEAAI